MIATIRRSAFAHALVNPPTETTSCDVTLRFVNSKGKIDLIKESTDFQTRYSLLILDPQSLGLTSSNQDAIDLFTENVVLAINLVLHRAALSTLGANLPQSQPEFKRPESRVVVEEKPEGKHITITEVLTIRDTVYLRIAFTEEINEDDVTVNLGAVNNVGLNRLPKNSKIELVNLSKALIEYRSAMSTFDRLVIFKHLFNSIELAANWDGIDRKGQDFDNEVVRITGLQVSEIEDWREFYNRTKHVDRTPKDITTFITGIENLHNLLMPLRLATAKTITKRLGEL